MALVALALAVVLIGAGYWLWPHRAPAEKFDGAAEISGTFAENASRKLVIEIGKGSGVGMAARKPTLSWK